MTGRTAKKASGKAASRKTPRPAQKTSAARSAATKKTGKAAKKPAPLASKKSVPKSAAKPAVKPQSKSAAARRPQVKPAAKPKRGPIEARPRPSVHPAPLVKPRSVPRPEPLTAADLRFFEGLLHREHMRLREDLGKLENTVLKRTQRDSTGDLSAYSIHMADLGTDAMEREKDLHLASAEGKNLTLIVDALARLADGTFGTCEACGGPIGRRRLEVVPYAVFCLACQEKIERGF